MYYEGGWILNMKTTKKLFVTFLTASCICLNLSTASANFGDVTLRNGSYGNDVVILQQKLNSLGYWCEADGIFGIWTQKKVQEFQREHGIKETGIVERVTAEKLIQLTGSKTKEYNIEQKIVLTAKQYLGVPYVWGGTDNLGFDCSGFTQFVMKKNGIQIPRTAAMQFGDGIPVAKENLKIGDLVFFTTYKPGASHVGFYIGDNQFIHASSAAGEVTISSLNINYYASRYIGARRYF